MRIKKRIENLEKRGGNRCLVVLADSIDEFGNPVSDRIDVKNHKGPVLILEPDADKL